MSFFNFSKSTQIIFLFGLILFIIVCNLLSSTMTITSQEGFEIATEVTNAVSDVLSHHFSDENKKEGYGNKCGKVTEGYGNKCGSVTEGYGNKCGSGKVTEGLTMLEGMENGKKMKKERPLAFFEKTTFSTECCPSQYTSSAGCACIGMDDDKIITSRGGNSTEPDFI
jgi:hypothetical protein